MLNFRHLVWLGTGAALLVFSAAFVAAERETAAPSASDDLSFASPEPVEIKGYAGDAMEPFVTRDGRWLIFNTRNGPRDQTDLMLARRIDDRHFVFVGPLGGVNSPSLDGVASVDRGGRFYFVSNRDFDRTGITLWTGRFADGRVTDVRPLPTDFTPKKLLRLNIDLEISADGSELIVDENRWNLFKGRPSVSHLAVASRVGEHFERRPDSDRLMQSINGDALAYAPATSADRLTLYFTRWNRRVSGDVPRLMVSRRASPTMAWSVPRRIAAAAGFVEGATLVPGECGILYHARIGEAYRLFLTRRRTC